MLFFSHRTFYILYMKFITLISLLVFASLSTAQEYSDTTRPYTFYLGGGITIPVSPSQVEHNFNSGFHVTTKYGFTEVKHFEAVIAAEYHMLGADYIDPDYIDGGDLSILLAGADLKYNLKQQISSNRPFFMGGIGLAIVSQADLRSYSGGLETFDVQRALYFQLGLGIHLQNLFFQGRYVHMFTDEEATIIIPLSIGISF